MKKAPTGETQSQGAVMATRPASAALNVMDTSGLPYLIQVKSIAVTVATAAARLVFMNAMPAISAFSAVSIATVEAPLKPNQQNHRINTPSAHAVMLCPGMARALPFLSYFPMRGPSIHAPRQAIAPPTMCTQVLPAKSWKPI